MNLYRKGFNVQNHRDQYNLKEIHRRSTSVSRLWENDFYEKISDPDAKLNGLKEQTDYLTFDDNSKDVNKRADAYINKMVAELKARVIAEGNLNNNQI